MNIGPLCVSFDFVKKRYNIQLGCLFNYEYDGHANKINFYLTQVEAAISILIDSTHLPANFKDDFNDAKPTIKQELSDNKNADDDELCDILDKAIAKIWNLAHYEDQENAMDADADADDAVAFLQLVISSIMHENKTAQQAINDFTIPENKTQTPQNSEVFTL